MKPITLRDAASRLLRMRLRDGPPALLTMRLREKPLALLILRQAQDEAVRQTAASW
jgi:hypothetical protein